MQNQLFSPPLSRYAAILTIIGSLFASQAEAQLINFDLSAGALDPYNTGVGVFGTASSQWNVYGRTSSAMHRIMFDDTLTVTSVVVDYTRYDSASSIANGAFNNLGISNIDTGGVTLSGLTAGGAYQLAVFSSWFGFQSFTVGSTTKTIFPTTNWSSLTEGSHYVLFQTVADNFGTITFTPGNNVSNSRWTAFQLQDIPAAVPEPSYAALMMVGLGAWLSKRRTARLA